MQDRPIIEEFGQVACRLQASVHAGQPLQVGGCIGGQAERPHLCLSPESSVTKNHRNVLKS